MTLRTATSGDAPAIAELMRSSVLDIFPAYYDPAQVASALRYMAVVDHALLADGTYFVHEVDGEIVASGGWSKRNLLFAGATDVAADRLLDPATEPARIRAMFVRADQTRRGLGTSILRACRDAARSAGFTMLALRATLPGVPLYRRFGFAEVDHVMITMPDGVQVPSVDMQRGVGE